MASRRRHIWDTPITGTLLLVGVALWEAFQGGGLQPYLTIPFIVFLVAIAQVVYALNHERNELKDNLDERVLRRKIASQLGRFLWESKEIYDDHNADPGPFEEPWRRWVTKVEAYLGSEPLLGQSCVSRFGVGAGISISIPDELELPEAKDKKRFWCRVHTRRARLIQFIEEMERGAMQ